MDTKNHDQKADRSLLRDIVAASDRLTEDESDAFGDINQQLTDGRLPLLSAKQRRWVEEVADRLGISFTRRHAELAENVPKGRDVPTVDVLSKDALQKALAARKR